MNAFRAQTEPSKIVTQYVFGPVRNFMLGAGLCYAIENEKYLHLPLVVLFPSIYAGYQSYNNKDHIFAYAKRLRNERA
jgi:hypothetical protein